MPRRRPPTPTFIASSDESLVDLARNGQAAGLGGLYDRYAERMLRTAWRLTGSTADAEDVVHDVFVALTTSLHQYEHRGALQAWLAQVTARAALMRIRKARSRHEADLSEAIATLTHTGTDSAAQYYDLERQIAALPEALRSVFVLREIEGFSHDEIAGLLEISPGASRVRLSRALVSLRAMLRPLTPLAVPDATVATRR